MEFPISYLLGDYLSYGTQSFRELIEDQIEKERRATDLLYDSAKKIDNAVIQLLLYQLALDSVKHGHMLKTILKLLDEPSKVELAVGDEEFRKVIEMHVEIEREMLEDFEKIIDETSDKRIRFIIQNIISDEKRHHATVKRLYALLSEGESVKDEKWWDFLFRYSQLTS